MKVMHKRISLYTNDACVGWEKHSSGQNFWPICPFFVQLLNFLFLSLDTHYNSPHIATTARGGQHQPTVPASRALWGNVNLQKQLCPRADIRNKLESLGMQQKRGKNIAGPGKIYHLQYVRSSATISAVCHLLPPALPKSDEKYWFKELQFPQLFIFFLALQSFCLLVWEALWCLLKVHYKKRFLTIFHILSR